ncbi:MAG: hypothetical protein CVV02_00950 [Firmicutes bacterium HGW-Firmicutes-7]|nr:MAG: hypothetical protein CVV02_00950 [Firmicutes bacterium HGW-Firmicutes-7]
MLATLSGAIITNLISSKFYDQLSEVSFGNRVELCLTIALDNVKTKYGSIFDIQFESFLNIKEVQNNITQAFKPNNLVADIIFRDDLFNSYDPDFKDAVKWFIDKLDVAIKQDPVFAPIQHHSYSVKSDKLQNAIMNKIIDQGSESNEMLKEIINVVNEMHDHQSVSNINVDDAVGSKLKASLVNYNKENRYYINSARGEIRVQFIVQKTELISKFNSIEEICNYVDENQSPVTLNAVGYKVFSKGKIIDEITVNSVLAGDSIILDFTSYGMVHIIDNFIDEHKDNEKYHSQLTISPSTPDILSTVDFYDSEMNFILKNVEFSYDRRYTDKGLLKTVLSNRHQKENSILVEFVISNDEVGVEFLNASINIDNKKSNSVEAILKWFEIELALHNGDVTFVIRSAKGDVSANLPFRYDAKQLDVDKIQSNRSYFKKLLFIERKLGFTFDLPDKISFYDFEVTEHIYNLIKLGKTTLQPYTRNFVLNENINELMVGGIYQFSFEDSEPILLLNKEINLGVQRYIISKAEVVSTSNNMKIKCCDDSVNLRIAHQYYGDFSLDEVIERELT